ncbi:MAG: hypothetical protein P8X87_07165 [Candidatus Bathyarchaeota archaeon]
MSIKKVASAKIKLLFLCVLLVVLVAATVLVLPKDSKSTENYPVEPYFGVSFCGDTPEEAKVLIDKIKDYTNLLVIQSGPVSKNETATNIICNYAVDAGLDFIMFFGWFDNNKAPWQRDWLEYATDTWGENFLGIYFFDEPGGLQLDQDWDFIFNHIKQVDEEYLTQYYEGMKKYVQGENQTIIRDYELVKNNYVYYFENHLGLQILNNQSIPAFTSDYGLYWFDYLGGYDTVFAELGWGHDSEKHIALCRGAANVQQKDWGTIIVWNELNEEQQTGEYKTAPEMLEEMMISYEAGADYIIIFNYPTNFPEKQYGILTDDHFEAMQQFWNYMEQNPDDYGKTVGDVALVLPENYGWGMRTLDDRIWGYWGPDEYSEQIWNKLHELLDQYGLKLDIVYDDPNYALEKYYPQSVYWNSTN